MGKIKNIALILLSIFLIVQVVITLIMKNEVGELKLKNQNLEGMYLELVEKKDKIGMEMQETNQMLEIKIEENNKLAIELEALSKDLEELLLNYKSLSNQKEELEIKIKDLDKQLIPLKNDLEVHHEHNNKNVSKSSIRTEESKATIKQTPVTNINHGKVAYLTFDDGPSKNTEIILDTLAKYNIKATFFVTANQQSDYSKKILKRIVEEGHVLANHSYSHDYKKIYSSLDAFKKDYDKMQDYIYEVTGVRSEIFRFPGGSRNNASPFGTSEKVRAQAIQYLEELGVPYFDWNIDSKDSHAVTVDKKKIIHNVLSNTNDMKVINVLMHDTPTKTTTAEALPKIIEGLMKQGYSFDKLSKDAPVIQFSKPKL